MHVECPRCARHAVVARVDDGTLLRCDHCLARELRPLTSARPLDGTEPTFGAQLWATTTVGRELLWVTGRRDEVLRGLDRLRTRLAED